MKNPLKLILLLFDCRRVKIENRTILYIFVPESSQVRCNGKIYDRNEDGDIDITAILIASLYESRAPIQKMDISYASISISERIYLLKQEN